MRHIPQTELLSHPTAAISGGPPVACRDQRDDVAQSWRQRIAALLQFDRVARSAPRPPEPVGARDMTPGVQPARALPSPFAADIAALSMLRTDAEEIELREQELSETHDRLAAALNTMPHGLLMLDAGLRVVLCNPQFRSLFGFDADIVRPGTCIEHVMQHSVALGNHPGRTATEVIAQMRARLGHRVRSAFQQSLPDGRLLAATWEPMPQGGWVCTYEDITARVAASERAAYLARHDATTGLPNRLALQEALLAAWPRRRLAGFNLICLEIDRFQAICDACGHAAGEEMLRRIAERLCGNVRDGDIVAHLRGATFAVLQFGPRDPEIAVRLARRLVDALQAPLRIDGRTMLPGLRAGIAALVASDDDPQPEACVEELLHNASLALNRAVQDGERVRFYVPDMDERARARHELELDLRNALELGQFALQFQPLVSVRQQRVISFEALLRWVHPQRGFVSPAVFIPLAEELGLIQEIGGWVLQTACAEAARWPADIRVAVNLSPLQFADGRELVRLVARALAESGLLGERLVLEITESLRLMDNAATLEILHDLHGLGALIALDDFGTGYSSLSYLRCFPFDKIKIDQSFVRSLPQPESLAIVRAIVALGSSLKIATVAEGVETRDQLDLLLAEGCDVMQGYLFSKPQPGCDSLRLIAEIAARFTSGQIG